jgi:hypothetical protein
VVIADRTKHPGDVAESVIGYLYESEEEDSESCHTYSKSNDIIIWTIFRVSLSGMNYYSAIGTVLPIV